MTNNARILSHKGMNSSESLRFEAVGRFAVSDVQALSFSRASELQGMLGHGSIIGIWETPRDWLSVNKHKSSVMRVDLGARIRQLLRTAKITRFDRSDLDALVDKAVLSLTRYLLLLRIGPAGMGLKGKNRSLKPSNLVGIAHGKGAALFSLAIEKVLNDKDTYANYLREDSGIISVLSKSDLDVGLNGYVNTAPTEWERMRILNERELWMDWPVDVSLARSAALTRPPLSPRNPADRDSHLPLPDEYVAEMGRRSLWLIKNIELPAVKTANELVNLRSYMHGEGYSDAYVRKKIRKMLASIVWVDAEGRQLLELPRDLFPEYIKPREHMGMTSGSDGAVFPPKTTRDMMRILGLIQMAHMFVVALSTGGRVSEVLGLKRGCVELAVDGHQYAQGRTFKLTQSIDGKTRDWLIPTFAAEVIESQSILVELADRLMSPYDARAALTKPETPDHLWAELSAFVRCDPRKPLVNINYYLSEYARLLGMGVEPGGQRLRFHRFRKTLARLVALAITQAPKILMDIFGHKSIEQTLYYILADKSLRAEIEIVVRELRVMMATEAVDKILESQLSPLERPARGGYGGLAAVTVDTAVKKKYETVHRFSGEWGANDSYELAELLTMHGTSWEMVRRGVICTKLANQSGPCNGKKGRPEAARCSSTCSHRLEEAFLREDVEGAIADSVSNYEKALANDELLMASHWSGQIRIHLGRFSDVEMKWVNHPTVLKAVGSLPGSIPV